MSAKEVGMGDKFTEAAQLRQFKIQVVLRLEVLWVIGECFEKFYLFMFPTGEKCDYWF